MKKGISLVSLVIVIMVLIIIAGIIVVRGGSSAAAVTANQFAVEILNIQTAVEEYQYRYNKYPVTTDVVFNTKDINKNSLKQFEQENIVDNQITLKLIDLSLIGITKSVYRNENIKGVQDVYALSEETGKIYYLAGIEYKGVMYYTLTSDMLQDFDLKSNVKVGPTDIKKQDVIFTVSNLNYTNTPITVDVKIPKEATFNSVTATESKVVSEEETLDEYKVIKVNQTGNNRNGNYKITVKYTYNQVQKTVAYAITTFDNTQPTVEINEQYGANTTDITINATDTESGIKQIKYELNKIENAEHFKYYGKVINGNKVTVNNNDTYTIYVEDKAGNTYLITKAGVPSEWRTNVTAIVDLVPVPKGFVASSVPGENKAEKGLVIYEGSEPVNSENVENAKRTRSQYVWIPVNKEKFDTEFIRKDYINSTSKIVDTLGSTNGYWEVVPTTQLNETNLQFMSEDTLKEVQEMYASVKKYGGFYIARYEAGIDEQRTAKGNAEDLPGIKQGTRVYSVMGKIPYTYIPWAWDNTVSKDTNGAVEIARNIYPEGTSNYGVVSTLTYGVQWDRTVQWLIDTGTVTQAQVNTTEGSTSFGNYKDHVISSKDDLNDKALVWDYTTDAKGSYVDKDKVTFPKATETKWVLSTGALKVANRNNIYDMAGNVQEWTMEGVSSGGRVIRGGACYNTGSDAPVSSRLDSFLDLVDDGYGAFGFRPSLYIKKTGTQTTVDLITFTVEGDKYTALIGMTWEQWCNSEYNPNKTNIYIATDIFGITQYVYYNGAMVEVLTTDIIEADENYITSPREEDII